MKFSMRLKDMPHPTKGPLVVDDKGRIVPAFTNTPELDWIADVSRAPRGSDHQAILCASSLMFDALKELARDPKFKSLARKTQELVHDALSAAE